MKRKLMIVLLAILLSAPMLTEAQSGTYYDDNVPVFVNTEAFGVHRTFDIKRKEWVWVNSMGGFICLDKNMRPMEEMDKHEYFSGINNDPDNPQVSPFSDVRKVWDNKRGCYVWKNIYTGDFLGTDKKSVMEQEKQKQKQQAQSKQNHKSNNKSNNKGQSKTQGKKNQSKHNDAVGKNQHNNNSSNQHNQNTNSKKTDQMLITSDEQLRQAEAAVREAKAQVAAAKAQGVDVNAYGPVDQYIKQAEDAINEYKRKRNIK